LTGERYLLAEMERVTEAVPLEKDHPTCYQLLARNQRSEED